MEGLARSVEPLVGLENDSQPGARDVVELGEVGGERTVEARHRRLGLVGLRGIEAARQLDGSGFADVDLEHQSPSRLVTVTMLSRPWYS